MDYVTARYADIREKSAAAFKIAVAKNPDKARAMLNLWFVPDFKPTFIPTTDQEAPGLDDVELLGLSDSTGEPSRHPVRMFDLDTKSLVDYPDIGVLGQYCILSHSWKGAEVDYKYVTNARLLDFSRVLLTAEGIQRSDIEVVKAQCEDDIEKQAKKIKDLASREVLGDLELGNLDDVVTTLLTKRVLTQEVERGEDGRGGLQKARRQLAWAQTDLQFTKMEDEVFEKLLRDIGLADAKANKSQGEGRIDPPEETVRKAEAKLASELDKQSAQARVFKFFEKNRHIRDAVDEMIYRLQRWKSAAKIEQSLERAKDIFDKKLFPKTEKRYLWIDSCCIDKSNSSEYVEGISAMGEWYGNAEFCLVHLDTQRSVPDEWRREWERFKERTPPKPNIKNFREILSYGPEWAKRAWTLQELVMSKATFYVNSGWDLLSRPVESLGPYYYFCPFIDIYTSTSKKNPYSKVLNDIKDVEALTRVLDRSNVEHPYTNSETHIQNGGFREPADPPIEPLNSQPEENISFTDPSGERLSPEAQFEADTKAILIAQKLIIILEVLGVHVPKDIDMETAKSRMTQSIYLAATRLTSSDQTLEKGVGLLLEDLLNTLQSYVSPDPKVLNMDSVSHAINILLKCLVKITKGLILDDRQYVAKFGNVDGLKSWQDGTVRSRFSTHKIMSLACPRESTVATDRAYSLMGLLGVRFPTFSAEGLTKALSRLLDEVVTSSNDVSVFNWTGKQFGSPIRGRSLYPSSPEAYKFHGPETRKMQKNQKLAELLHIKRYEVMGEFLNISGMLQDAITFAKDRQQKNFPRHWLKEILKVVKEAEFAQLKPHITNIGRILSYIQTHCSSEQAASPTSSKSKGPEKAVSNESSSYPFGFQSPLKIPSPHLESMSFRPKFMSSSSDSGHSSPTHTSKTTIGGFKASLGKGFGKRDSGSSKAPSEVIEPAKPSSPSLSTAKTLPDQSKEVRSMTPTKSPKQHLDEEVMVYIKSILNNEKKGGSESELPYELREVLADIPVREFSNPYVKPEEIESMISPNPIIINNSGIQGFFDIQRVVVTMLQPEKLRRQIDNAISPHQKITGWCTISTGFAMVMVSFACEKHILEKQLDVIQVVETKILKEQSGVEDEEEEEQEAPSDKESENEEKPTKKGKSRLKDRFKMSSLLDGAEPLASGGSKPEGNKVSGEAETKDTSEETAKVSRMIKFVQEPSLAAIAGEWVLARFSGAPGAKWFLCYLELSSTQDFYGQRIPTDEIDFHDASPEMGLLRCWEVYMMRKKRKLCGILQNLLESKNMDSLKAVESLAELAELAEVTTNKDTGDGASDEESPGTQLDQNVEQGALVLARAGAGLVQKFYELRAEQLERNLSAAVLKRIPTHMQAALENLNDNKDLMPSMFHSAKKIHMF